MVTDNKIWHYLAVKKLPALFCNITSSGQKINLNSIKLYVKIMSIAI